MWFNRKRIDNEQWQRLNTEVMKLSRENSLDEALAKGKELFTLSTRTYGKRHVNTATALNNLGIIHSLRKEFDEAESFLLASLQLSERVSGRLSKEVATVNMNLARFYTIKAKSIYEIIGTDTGINT